MGQKIKLDGKEIDVDTISVAARENLSSLQFTSQRVVELKNILKLYQEAKNSYIGTLKREMISTKAGFLIDDE